MLVEYREIIKKEKFKFAMNMIDGCKGANNVKQKLKYTNTPEVGNQEILKSELYESSLWNYRMQNQHGSLHYVSNLEKEKVDWGKKEKDIVP